jgi:hypothetical protein
VLTRIQVHAGTDGLQYVAYERTCRGLLVVGGDAVVVTDRTGATSTTAALMRAIE